MLEFVCPHCGDLLRVEENMVGHQGKGKKCGSPITVPEAGRTSTSFDSLADEELERAIAPPPPPEPLMVEPIPATPPGLESGADETAPAMPPGSEPIGLSEGETVEAASFGAYGKAADAGWVDPSEQVRKDGAAADMPEIPIHVLRRKAKNERRKKIRSIVSACIAVLLAIMLLVFFLREKPEATLPEVPEASEGFQNQKNNSRNHHMERFRPQRAAHSSGI